MRTIDVKLIENDFEVDGKRTDFFPLKRGEKYRIRSNKPLFLKRSLESSHWDFLYQGEHSLEIPALADNRNDIGAEKPSRGLVYRYGENVIEDYLHEAVAPGRIRIDRKDIPAIALLMGGKLLQYGKDYEIVIDVYDDGRLQDKLVFIRSFPTNSKMRFIWGLFHLGDIQGNGTTDISFEIPQWYYRDILFLMDASLNAYCIIQLMEQEVMPSLRLDNMTSEYFLSFPQMKQFLTDYLRYHEQILQPVDFIRNFEKYRFFDVVLGDFLDHLKRTLASDISLTPAVSLKDFLYHVSDFYQHKGTPESISFLLRVLFNVESRIFTPKDKVLSLSDAPNRYDIYMHLEELDSIVAGGYGWKVRGFDVDGIQLTGGGFLGSFDGQQIFGVKSGAVAYLEHVDGSLFKVHEMRGKFEPWEGVILSEDNLIDGKVAIALPLLGGINIVHGGSGYVVGDGVFVDGASGGYVNLTGDNGEVFAIRLTENPVVKDTPKIEIRRREPGQEARIEHVETAVVRKITREHEEKSRLSNPLQDGFYWQDFSYEVVSPLTRKQYENQILENAHVVGSEMFSRVDMGHGDVQTHEGFVPSSFYKLGFGVFGEPELVSQRNSTVLVYDNDQYVERAVNETPEYNGKLHFYRYMKQMLPNPFEPLRWERTNITSLSPLDDGFLFFKPVEMDGTISTTAQENTLPNYGYFFKLGFHFHDSAFIDVQINDVNDAGAWARYRIYPDKVVLHSFVGTLKDDIRNTYVVFRDDMFLFMIDMVPAIARQYGFSVSGKCLVFGAQFSNAPKAEMALFGADYDNGWHAGIRQSEKVFLTVKGDITFTFNTYASTRMQSGVDTLLAAYDSNYNQIGVLDIPYTLGADYVHVACSYQQGSNEVFVKMNDAAQSLTLSAPVAHFGIIPTCYSHLIVEDFKVGNSFVGDRTADF